MRWGFRRATLPAAAIVAMAGMMVWVPGVAASAGGASRSSRVSQVSRVTGAARRALTITKTQRAVNIPPTVSVGNNPAGLAFDAGTHTLYVTNSGSNTVSVIDTKACNAKNSRDCHQDPHSIRLPAGASAQGIELDTVTDTAYVADLGTNTISVINTRNCNATDVKGCHQTPSSIKDPDGPINLGVDRATDTVYVANGGESGASDTVSVIDGASCNGHVISGCAQTPPMVKVAPAPVALAVDQATNTVYVAIDSVTHGANGGTVSVIDGASCDGIRHSGCGQTAESIAIAAPSNWIELDAATHTVYTANSFSNNNYSRNNVSVINTAICNATNHAGCNQKTSTVRVGSNAFAITVDQALHTVYVANNEDDTLSVINSSTCDAAHRSGCGHVVPTSQVGGGPQFLVTAPTTGTVYSANFVGNTVSVINAAACDATNTAGCRHPAPTAPVGAYPAGIAVDQAHHSIYVANVADNTVSVINAATCNATHRTHCRPTARVHVAGSIPFVMAIDQATGTLYVANNGNKTVSVINTAACNATHPAGCKQTPPLVHVGAYPYGIAVNTRTDTIYVTDTTSTSTYKPAVSVINGATCNATHHAGCSQKPPSITLGSAAGEVAVNDATDTVYVAGNNNANTAGIVAVINGATCNGRNHTGCAHTPATVTVGAGPFGIAVDQATNTIYVASDAPSTLSVIKGATCDATNTTGCHRKPPVLPGTGWSPLGIAYDPSTHTIYTANTNDATVSVVDVARRRPQAQPPKVAVGISPFFIAIDHADHTVYVTNSGPVGKVSILPEKPVRTTSANQADFHASDQGNNVAGLGKGSRASTGDVIRQRRQSTRRLVPVERLRS